MTYGNHYSTERLTIRPTTIEDAAFILELMNTPKWLKFIGDRNVKSIADAQSYIQSKMSPQIEKLGYGNFTIIRKSDDLKIGTCGLYDREGLKGIDIGFSLLPDYEKKGYAYESANKIKEIALNNFNIKQINAITTTTNIASQNLLKKLGLSYKEMIKIENDSEELMFFQLY